MANQEWIDDVLEAVNEMRRFHQADELEWSDECYQAAKKQAEACSTSSKLVSGNTSGESGPHGQSLHAAEPGGFADISGATQEWYEKSENYDFFKAAAIDGCEDFTQLVWIDTQQVGAAISDCGRFLVANYFPAGNVDGAYGSNVLLPEFEADEDVEGLGMTFSSFPPRPLIVKKVNDDSWAESVDISDGDRFYSINDEPVVGMSTDDFKKIMQTRPLRLKLLMGVPPAEEAVEEEDNTRKKATAEDTARRGSVGRGKTELVADESVEKIGMILSLPPKALEVRKVTPGGWADVKGIEPGDIFMEVNGTRVSDMTPEEFMEAMKNRPIRFKLASEEEQKAAVIMQKHIRKSLAQNLSKVSDWRLARSRKAQEESGENKDEPHASGQTREELMQAVFDACDQDGDGRLKKMEMLRFVRHIDFPGTDEDWDIEYGELCNEYKWGKAVGLAFEDFRDLVEDENGNPYYCGNDRLDGIMIGIQKTDAATKIQKTFKGRSARKNVTQQREQKKANDEADAKKKKDEKPAPKEEQVEKTETARERSKRKQKEKEEEEAAKKIQSIQRGKQARADLLKQKEEKKTKEDKKKKENKEEEDAAKRIQSIQRGKKARAEVEKKKADVKKKKEDKEEEDAAKKIQSIQRGKKARAEVEKKKQEVKKKKEDKEEEDAAKKIQSIQRGKKARAEVEKKKQDVKKKKEDKEEDEAAKKIQSIQRGKKSRAETKKLKEDKAKAEKSKTEDKEKEAAAKKIQSIQRGKKARERASRIKEDKDQKEKDQQKEDRMGKTETARERAKRKQEEKEEEEAAKKRQSIQRAKIAREEILKKREERLKEEKTKEDKTQEEKEREEAAKKIQAMHRGNKARAETKKKREEKNQQPKAGKKMEKGPSSMKLGEPETTKSEEQEREEAARKIQAASRSRADRLAAKEERKARKAKEENEREASEFRDGMRDEDAACKIQAAERGRMQRKDLVKRKQAFFKLDQDGDGYLNELEMKNFACFLGYNGSDSEWRQEYDALCYQFRWDSRVGLSERDFIWLTTNPNEQYWFDAKLLDQGWEVAAEMPADALGDTLYPGESTPGGQRIPSGAEVANVLRQELQRSSVEVPVVAEVSGLDWERLFNNEDLKDKLQQNIRRILNQKTGINAADLKVTLSSASRAMPGRA